MATTSPPPNPSLVVENDLMSMILAMRVTLGCGAIHCQLAIQGVGAFG
jgi:hypothetical protein